MDADKADKAIEQALKDQQKMLSDKIKALERWDEKDKAQFKKWFGANDDKTRDIVKERLKKSLEHSKSYKPENFEAGDPEFIKKNPTVFAYVTKDNPDKIYLGPSFATAPATGTDSKAGTIGHEMTHFNKIAGTDDVVYGQKKSLQLAKDNPADALRNADSHEYYLEEGS